MNHILVADRIWLGRLAGRVPEPGFIGGDGIKSLDQELASDFDDLRRGRDTTDAAIDVLVETLTAERLAGMFSLTRKGQTRDVALRWIVTQLFNHQTHHRWSGHDLAPPGGGGPGVDGSLRDALRRGERRRVHDGDVRITRVFPRIAPAPQRRSSAASSR